MAIINYSDLIKDDGAFDDVLGKIEELEKRLKSVAKEKRQTIKVVSPESTEDLKKYAVELNKLRKDLDSLKKTKQAVTQAKKKASEMSKKELIALTKEREAMRLARAEAKAIVRVNTAQKNSIEQLRARLTLVTNAWKKLTESELENTKRGRRLNKSKKEITETLKRLERATADNRRNVGNYNGAINKLRGSFVNLTSAMGVGLGMFGAMRLIRNSTAIVRDFEKQNATLAGVLNKEKTEIKELTEQAKELGSTTVKTASEVTALQIAYARLGFAEQEIIDMTEATISASIAMNSSLDETANLIGAVVNSYDNLSSVDAEHISEVLTAGTTKSALTFEKLKIALPKVMGASNALGISLEETVATLGKLTDAGIEASIAGTSLRKVYSTSAKLGINYKEAIDKIVNSQNKYADAVKIFGERAAVSAVLLANNTEGLQKLTNELENAKVVQRLVNNELNTLDGSLKLLKSAWEGYILNMNDATGTGNALTRTIRFLAENLDIILNTIITGTSAWIAYNVVQKAGNVLAIAKASVTRIMTFAQIRNTAVTEAGTVAQEAFNTATKATPWGFIIAMITAVAVAYSTFKTKVDEAKEAQKAFNKAQKEALEQERGEIQKTTNEYRGFYEMLRIQRQKDINAGMSERKAELKYQKNRLIYIQSNIRQEEIALENLAEKKKELDKYYKKGTIWDMTGGADVKKQYGELAGKEKAHLLRISELQREIDRQEVEHTKTLKEQTKAQKEEYAKRQKQLEALKRRLEDLNDSRIKDDEEREIKQMERKYTREIKAIKGNGEVEIALRKSLEEQIGIETQQIRDKYKDKRIALKERALQIERDLMEGETEQMIAKETERTKKLIATIEKNSEIETEKKLELIIRANDKLRAYKERVTNDAILKDLSNQLEIEKAKIDQKRSLFKTEEDFEKWKNEQLLKVEKEYLKKRLAVLQKANNKDFAVEIEKIKGRLATIDDEFANKLPSQKDKVKQFANEVKQSITLVSDQIEKLLNKAVERSQKALEKQQNSVDKQRELAEKGLSNTLAFEQREMAKREAELVKANKRLEKIQKIKALYSSYASNSSNPNVKNPLLKTLKDFAILEAISASFYVGGYTGDGGKYDPKGIVHGGEFVIDKETTAELGLRGDTMKEFKEKFISKSIWNKREGAGLTAETITRQRKEFTKQVPVVNFDTTILEQEIRELKEFQMSQEVQKVDVRKLVDGTLEFVETIITQGKEVTYRHRVKKDRI